MNPVQEFEGKVVLITGSSTGIGAATAVEFARRGASVSITGRNAAKLEEVAKKCEEASPSKIKVLATVGDVTNDEDNVKLIENTVCTFGKIDILVNNAGVTASAYRDLELTCMEDDEILATNLRAPYYITKLAIPHLKKTKGNIVNVSSAGSLVPVPKSACYATSKAGLDHFTRCIAAELAPSGVRVNCVNPGPVKTDITRNRTPEDKKRFDSYTTPLGRFGQPEEIADAIAFLASEKATFITGSCLPVDGGFCIKLDMGMQKSAKQ